MTETPANDSPGFVTERPEHCSACFRLIRPGQTYYLNIENMVLCADCALVEEIIRVRDELAVEVKRDRLLVRRGKAEVEVFPGEIRHLVNALTEPAEARLPNRGKGDALCRMLYARSVAHRILRPTTFVPNVVYHCRLPQRRTRSPVPSIRPSPRDLGGDA